MSYAERGADCIDIVRQCVGEYVPGRAGTRSNCQRALDQTEKLLDEADAEIARLRAVVGRCEALRDDLRRVEYDAANDVSDEGQAACVAYQHAANSLAAALEGTE